MSYIESSLSPGEKVVALYQLHWVNYLWPAILCLTILLAPIGILQILRLKFTEMGLTSRRVIRKTGIIARQTDEMPLRSLETATLHQGVLDRILGSGSVRLTGRGISDVLLFAIEAPLEAKKQIEATRHALETSS